MSEQPTTPRTVADQREALVQAAYFQIAMEKNLAVICVAPGRARVPGHWRAEAEELARPYLDALGAEQAREHVRPERLRAVLSLRGELGSDGVIFGCPWCADVWESEATCEHARTVVEHDAQVAAQALQDAADACQRVGVASASTGWLRARAARVALQEDPDEYR